MSKEMMSFQDAFQLVNEIHEQCGDKQAWGNLREEAKGAVEKYDSFNDYYKRLYMRTDISDDFRWDIDCMDGSLKVLFALMKGQPNE